MNKMEILQAQIDKAENIVISTHVSPDGDAIGSTLALYHYLLKYNHNATVIVPNDYPKFLKWIPGENSILKHDSQTKECDTLIKDSDIVFTFVCFSCVSYSLCSKPSSSDYSIELRNSS